MSRPVIVALDFDSAAQALSLAQSLGHLVDTYKVGLELLVSAGPDVIDALRGMGKDVYLDVKLHEIPASVRAAVRAAGRRGVSLITVHATAGDAVLRAAVDEAAQFPGMQVLALTVITSLRDTDLPALGLTASVDEQVRRLALLARECGCHGVVASALEAPHLRAIFPRPALIVTPGIHLPETDTAGTDQARVATPETAARNGADAVVMGRAVTGAPDPRRAAQRALSLFQAGCAT